MIWCIEDDETIREIALYALQTAGFEVQGFADGSVALQKLPDETPELILLDVMLPNMDGVEILKTLKASSQTKDIPVIMATAKGTEYDKVKSLDLGADDYLVKPYGVMEMISRVKAVLRRSNTNQRKGKVLTYKGIELDLTSHISKIDDEIINLTFKEFELLKLFLTHAGEAIHRDYIFAVVWETDYVGDSRTLDMHIKTLRQKLGHYGQCIKTIRNIGYRWEK